MNILNVCYGADPDAPVRVGRLAEDKGSIVFEYDAGFIRSGLEISPYLLPLSKGLHRDQTGLWRGLHGVFDDSLPDGWGLLLMDRHLRRGGQDPATVSPLYRLAWLGRRTMGALTYVPAIERKNNENELLDIQQLAANAQDVLEGDTAEILPVLLAAGGSPGGARPKVLVGIRNNDIISGADMLPANFEPWMIKFCARKDAAYAGPVEYAYAGMARAAGIDMPETRLFEARDGKRYFGVKRFDRIGKRRIHMHSFGNMIGGSFREPCADYIDLLKLTLDLTRDASDVQRAFRLMTFNVLAHNRDDHVKQFAFLMGEDGEWRLSPGYDLSFTDGPGGEHTTSINGKGKGIDRTDLISVAAIVDIHRNEANAIVDKVADSIECWRQWAREADVPANEAIRIQDELERIRP